LPVIALIMPQRTVGLGPVGAAFMRTASTLDVAARAASVGVRLSGSSRQNAATTQSSAQTFSPTAKTSRTDIGVGLLTLVWAVGALLMLFRFRVGTILV